MRIIKIKNTDPRPVCTRRNAERFDALFLLAVVILCVMGTFAVFSAGSAYAYARYDDADYFIKKQTVWLLAGFAVMIISSRIDSATYKNFTLHFYIATVVLLILVLIIGFAGNGAQRWISIGPLTLQPSEIAKLSLIMMLAKYFSDNEIQATSNKSKGTSFVFGTLLPCLIMLLPIILVMLQHHLSCIIILGTIGLIVIFSSGIDPRYIGIFCAVGIIAISCLALFTDYTKDRITVWQNPEAYRLTGGWQTLQGLMAIGSGGLFGCGFGKSVLKHCYVSEPANDMIFAIVCEETGFIGALIVLAVFAVLIYRGIAISLHAPDTYTRLLAFGICVKISVQVLLNVAVVTNTIPNTGISLPFFSYGGSSLIMLLFEMGIMLSISKKSKIGK